PGSSGSLEMAKIFREMKINKEILLTEGKSIPMWGRRIEPGVIRTSFPYLRSMQQTSRLQGLSAFPAKRTNEAIEKLKDIYKYKPSKNVLEVGILNANFLIHPAPFIMNLGIIQNTKGDFSLLNEGISPSVIEVMEALDSEKLELCKTLNISESSLEDCYGIKEGIIPAYLRKVPGPLGFKDKILDINNCRYLVEDTCGLVMWSSLGDLVNIETPITDSIILLANIVQGLDFWTFGRTVDKMGLTDMNVEDIEKYLYHGKLI
ncbi:NAD/NADP octopine/nopaline dehydrogenase family protein, partial [Thermoproteota archaeon]